MYFNTYYSYESKNQCSTLNWLLFFKKSAVKIILKYCDSVESILKQCSQGSYAPLHIACLNSSFEICELLLKTLVENKQKFKEIANGRNEQMQTPLMFACERKNFNIIKLFFSFNNSDQNSNDRLDVDVNGQDINGNTCMHYLFKNFHLFKVFFVKLKTAKFCD